MMRTCSRSVLSLLVATLGVSHITAQNSEPPIAEVPAGEEPAGKVPAKQDPAAQSAQQRELAQRMQALIDAFIGGMPRNPADLRQPEVRRKLAPTVLPVLQRIEQFADAHPDCMLAERVFEFTIYSLVLAKPEERHDMLTKRRLEAHSIPLLLGATDIIVAADAIQRSKAITAFVATLRPQQPAPEQTTPPQTTPPQTTPPQTTPPQSTPPHPQPVEASMDKSELDANVLSCALQCLAVAAKLSADEARLLAKHCTNKQQIIRFQEIATAVERDPEQLLNKPLELTGTQLDGTPLSLASLRGNVVLLEFWASWCGPCVRAMPELVAIKQQYGARKFKIVGVNCDTSHAKLKTFLAAHPEVDWPHLVPKDGAKWHALATQLGVTSIPRLFLIDQQGVLRSVDAKEHLKELLDRYLVE